MNVILNGLNVHYQVHGSGPVMLMLHGWGSDLQVYDHVAESFYESHQVVRFDWPGFGRSQAPSSDWGIDEYAAFTRAFCHKISIEATVLVGHSMGGQTAVNLVGRRQIKPQKLVLLAASAVRPQPTSREKAYKVVAKLGKLVVRNQAIARRLKTRLYSHAGTMDYLNSGVMQASYRRIITQDQREYAAKISVPTLLLWGDHDTDAPLARGKLLHQTIPHAQMEVLPGAGHYLFLDEPKATIASMKRFIDA